MRTIALRGAVGVQSVTGLPPPSIRWPGARFDPAALATHHARARRLSRAVLAIFAIRLRVYHREPSLDAAATGGSGTEPIGPTPADLATASDFGEPAVTNPPSDRPPPPPEAMADPTAAPATRPGANRGRFVLVRDHGPATPWVMRAVWPRPLALILDDGFGEVPLLGPMSAHIGDIHLSESFSFERWLQMTMARLDAGIDVLLPVLGAGIRLGTQPPRDHVRLLAILPRPWVPVAMTGLAELWPPGAWVPKVGEVEILAAAETGADALGVELGDPAALAALRERLEVSLQVAEWQLSDAMRGTVTPLPPSPTPSSAESQPAAAQPPILNPTTTTTEPPTTAAAPALPDPPDTTSEVPRCCHGLPQERRAGARQDAAQAPARLRETPVSRSATGPPAEAPP